MTALAERLADEWQRLDELRAGNLAVRASFEVSFAALSNRTGTGGLDPTRLFWLLGLWTGPSISLPAAAALAGEPKRAVSEALDVLVDAHLLESPEPDRYRFHDLLRAYAAGKAREQETEEDRRRAVTRLLTWYLHTTGAAAKVISPQHSRVPLDPPPAGAEPLQFERLDQALAWCEDERAGLLAAPRLAADYQFHEIAWKLPAAALSFYYRRSYHDWVITNEIGLASARLLGDRRAEAWMLNILGIAYSQQRVELSIPSLRGALSLWSECGDLHGQAKVTMNLAVAYHGLRRYDEARELSEQSLSLQRAIGNRYGEGLALLNLGCAWRELGHSDKASEPSSSTDAWVIARTNCAHSNSLAAPTYGLTGQRKHATP